MVQVAGVFADLGCCAGEGSVYGGAGFWMRMAGLGGGGVSEPC